MNSEHKSQRKSSRHEDEINHSHGRHTNQERNSGKDKKEDKRHRQHQGEHMSAKGPMQRKTSEEDHELKNPINRTPNPDVRYDDYSANYEDDFEDYEDDFDDDDDDDSEDGEMEERVTEIPVYKMSEIETIQRAINAENERIGISLPMQIPKEYEKEPRTERQDSPARGSLGGKFMDFATAKHRQNIQKITSKQKKRSSELLRLIDLDFSVSFSLLDLPPVNEYDMYIRNFGRTNTKQVGS
uniref:Dynein 2 intermediate chain 1 n=1 Tax=Sphenodon punctatus TaxID=8508 RepID=A0A8D0H3H3_SPHPU